MRGKLVATIFGLILLHNPQFKEIYVASDAIVSIAPGTGYCIVKHVKGADQVLTYITTSGPSFCVIESVSLVGKMVKAQEDEE